MVQQLKLIQQQLTQKRWLQIGQINPKQRFVNAPKPKPIWRKRLNYYSEQIGFGILILAGIAFTAVITFELGSELFEAQEPSNLFDQVSKIVKSDERIEKLVGQPVKCSYGPPGTRYRLFSTKTIVGRNTNLQIQFYVSGPLGSAICNAEALMFKDKLDIQQIIVEGMGGKVSIVDKHKVGKFGFGKSLFHR